MRLAQRLAGETEQLQRDTYKRQQCEECTDRNQGNYISVSALAVQSEKGHEGQHITICDQHDCKALLINTRTPQVVGLVVVHSSRVLLNKAHITLKLPG